MIGASISWSTGSFLSRGLSLPRNPFVATAWEMAAGGVFLTGAALATGEWRELDGAAFALDSVLAWVYLVVMGSLVVTHQYVNPLVAITLGMLLLGERPGPWTLAGALLVVAAVYVAVRAESPTRTRPATAALRETPAGRTV